MTVSGALRHGRSVTGSGVELAEARWKCRRDRLGALTVRGDELLAVLDPRGTAPLDRKRYRIFVPKAVARPLGPMSCLTDFWDDHGWMWAWWRKEGRIFLGLLAGLLVGRLAGWLVGWLGPWMRLGVWGCAVGVVDETKKRESQREGLSVRFCVTMACCGCMASFRPVWLPLSCGDAAESVHTPK